MTAGADALVGNPLSLDQLRLWRLLLDCQTQSFRSYGMAKVDADFSLLRLRLAFEQIARDSNLLRSRLVSLPGLLYPVQMEQESDSAVYRDMGSLGSDAEAAIDRMAHELATAGFALEDSSLIHVCFGRLESGAVLWGMALPAFLGDGPSIDIVLTRTSRVAAGLDEAPERFPVSYPGICRWREQIVAAEEASIGKLFWKERLGPHDAAPWDSIVPDARIKGGAHAPGIQRTATKIPAADFIAKVGGADSGSVQAGFLAAWYFLLWKLSNCPGSGFHVAAQFDGRAMDDLSGAIGPLERFLPVESTIQPNQPFRTLCDDIARQLGLANEWQDCFTWSDFVDPADYDAQIRSYDYCFELLPGGVDAPAGKEQITLPRRFSRSERYKLKLDVRCGERDQTEIALYYDPAHYAHHHAQQLLDSYCHLLKQVTRNDVVRLWDIEWSAVSESAQSAPARSPVSSVDVESLVDRLSRMAAQHRDRIALVSSEHRISYGCLDRCTDALAVLIRDSSLAPESCVAVMGELSFPTIIGFLASLKAGHCFVYIDPQHPPARSLQILRESNAKLVLCDDTSTVSHAQSLARQLGMRDEAIISLSDDLLVQPRAQAGGRTDHPEQLAYITYTSGSTGVPNGVMISHRALATQIAALIGSFDFSSDDSWLLKTPLGFDASIWEWLTPLCTGATLVFGGPRLHLHPERIVSTVRDHRVTVLQVVPNLLRTLMSDTQPGELASLRYLFVGGEPLPADLCWAVKQRSQATLVNLYGPTETTINATWWSMPREWTLDREVSIGQPVAEMSAHVLDKLGQPLPTDFIGELHLTGSGLARGYAQKPGTTAEKFIPAPFAAGQQMYQRMYRTGDLVSRDGSGQLFYWGRLDSQVKVRGYRIELGEIEAVLCLHSSIRTAAACVRQAGGAQLVVYGVPKNLALKPSVEELRGYLRDRLPEYMVPASIIVVDALPVTSSGKVDRRMLQSPELLDLHRSESYAPPQTRTQATLCEIWQQILEVDSVGIRDDFLRLGGQSLLVTRLVAHVRQSLGVEISPRMVFDFPVLQEFAAQIDRLTGCAAEAPPAFSSARG